MISLDDLLDEKMAVQKSCSSSKTVHVGKYIGSEGNPIFSQVFYIVYNQFITAFFVHLCSMINPSSSFFM